MTLFAWLDRVLYRPPLAGTYATVERPSFGDLDSRLVDGLPMLANSARLLDLGVVRQWARRTAELHGDLASLADVASDPRWWLVAGGAALDWQEGDVYVASDAEPSGDTFIGHAAPAPVDPIADALARAHAARQALRELDGAFPGQPLAVTIERTARGAVLERSALEVAAFAVGDRVISHRLARSIEDEDGTIEHVDGVVPFVTIAIGEEALETARHGHRRGWTRNGSGGERGPWLGLGRAGGLAIVSTCHLIVDGYGHARLAARIGELLRTGRASTAKGATSFGAAVGELVRTGNASLAPVVGAIPLTIAWRELPSPAPRALALAYALGRLLHRAAGRPEARFSPTFQIPIAPGARDDATRMGRRVVPALASVRFDAGVPEPFEMFAARTAIYLAREAGGDGLFSRLLAAARALPAPLAWKRRAVGTARPRWLEPVADVIGGRGCVSRIRLDIPAPLSCAVSSPAQLATDNDPLGGCVVTVIDDGAHAAITVCGSGAVGTVDPSELLALLP